MIYVASPYSDPDPAVRRKRFAAAAHLAACLIRTGRVVFSPIVHSHPIQEAGEMPTGWEFWRTQDEWYLRAAAAFYVYVLPGWRKSAGVRAEITFFQKYHGDIPIRYVTGDGRLHCDPEVAEQWQKNHQKSEES